MDNGRSGSGYLGCYDASVTPATFIPAGTNAADLTTANQGWTQLTTGKTYYFPLGVAHAPVCAEDAIVSIHEQHDASLAGVWTYESANFPGRQGNLPTGPTDDSVISTVVGDWIQENPASAVVAVAGAGTAATALTVTVTAGNIGAFFAHLGNHGARRGRLKFVCTATGRARVNVHGKLGA